MGLSIITANYSLIGTQSYLVGKSASASSTIGLYTDGACTKSFGSGSTTSSSSNNWYFSLSGITAGLYTVYAKETISNTSTISNGVSIYVYSGKSGSNALYDYTTTNTINPPPSTYSGKYQSTPNITTPTINTSGLVTTTTNNVTRYLFSTTPSISGSSDPYAMIELSYQPSDSVIVFGLTQANSAGKWTYDYTTSSWYSSTSMTTGNTYFIAKAYDEDYNYSSDAEIAVTIIDSTSKPSAPVITSSFSSTIATGNTVTIAGTCVKGTYDLSKVTLSYTSGSNTTYFIKTIGSSDTEWSIDAYLPNGTYTLTATVTDAVGNESTSSTSVTVTVNVSSATTTAEINTVISNATTASNVTTSTTATDASFASQVNGTVVVSNASSTSTSTASITYSGFTPNTTITLYIQSDPVYLGTYTTDANGTVIVTLTTSNVAGLSGVHSLSAVDTVTNTVKTIPLVVVSSAANAATGLSYVNEIIGFTFDDSTIQSGLGYTVGKIYITNKKIKLIAGRTTIGNTAVNIYKNGNNIASNISSRQDGGIWGYTPSSSLSDGTYTISAGGATDTDKIITLIIDTIPPVKPIIKTTAQNTISGSAEANSNVIIRENNKVLKTVTASAQGNWFYKPDFAMPARQHNFSIVAQDAANNNSDVTNFTNDFTFAMNKSLVKLVPGQPVNVQPIIRSTVSDPSLSFMISPAQLPLGLRFDAHSGKISGVFTGSSFVPRKYIVTTRSSVFIPQKFALRMEM
jgi:hypothetical protein